MNPRSTLVALLLPMALGACLANDSGPELGSHEQALDNNPSGTAVLLDVPRASKVVMDPVYEQQLVAAGAVTPVAAGTTALIYMNRDGGTFSPGQSNASTNRTTLARATVNFPAANLSEGEWSEVMTCVRQQFSRFNVEVTDVDPGATPHYESVVAGSPQLLGMPAGVGGVSPFTSNCDLIPNSIVFTFTDVLPRDPQTICEVAAQEIAHSFGLDHEYLCSDPMTYLRGCGAKSFQDVFAPCGEGSPRACAQPGVFNCGYAEQNSVQLLTERVGLKQGGDLGAASISTPLDGANVVAGFEVHTDVSGVATVELRIDGKLIATLESGSYYFFTTPVDLALGTHILEISSTQNAVTTTDSISVTVTSNGNGNGDDGGGSGQPQTPQVTGGCSTSGGGGSGGLAFFLLGLAFVRLRRDS